MKKAPMGSLCCVILSERAFSSPLGSLGRHIAQLGETGNMPTAEIEKYSRGRLRYCRHRILFLIWRRCRWRPTSCRSGTKKIEFS